ncbi:hypothetical protein E2320_017097, partial [Naja naja]
SKGLLTQTLPLEFAVNKFQPCNWVLIKAWDRPYQILLNTETATQCWFLQICLVMFFTNVSSQHCDQLHSRLQEDNKGNLELLGSHMRATIPLECIGDIADFSPLHEENVMSMNEASHEEDAKIAIQEMLQQTDLIFKQGHAELFWDETSLRNFHTGLDQQIKRLETCQSAAFGAGTSPRAQKLQLTRLRVKRYFQGLNDFLKDKQYSSCAWEIVQIQLRECFLLIHQLVQRIPTQGTMKTQCWFLQICLVMFFTNVSSQHCDQLHSRLQEDNKGNLELLGSHMRATIPLECIGDIADFSPLHEENVMSMNEASHEEDAKIAIQEMLQQTDLIFKQGHAELFWDETSLRNFHTGLDQQIKRLETCQSAAFGAGTSARAQKLQLISLRVKRYFQGLNDFLNDKQYSSCAWEIVQIHLRECFLLIHQLVQRIPT